MAAEIAAKQSTGRALDTPGEPLAPARADDLEQERRRAGLAELQRERERLLRVHQRLRTGARAHCADEQGPVLGALLGRRAGVGYDNRSEAVFESTQELRVLAVLEGGAADEAGLRAGDVVRRVNGAEVERTQDAFAALRAQPERAPTLQIARADEILEVSLPLVTGCRHDLILTTDEAFDTRADDDRDTLLVPHGLLRFAASDDELAFALAHQLAHHLLDTTQNSRIADEPPADRLAVQLVRNAGFDAGVATALLDRMVAMDPGKLGYDTPGNYMGSGTWHGGAAERALAIRAELELLADGR